MIGVADPNDDGRRSQTALLDLLDIEKQRSEKAIAKVRDVEKEKQYFRRHYESIIGVIETKRAENAQVLAENRALRLDVLQLKDENLSLKAKLEKARRRAGRANATAATVPRLSRSVSLKDAGCFMAEPDPKIKELELENALLAMKNHDLRAANKRFISDQAEKPRRSSHNSSGHDVYSTTSERILSLANQDMTDSTVARRPTTLALQSGISSVGISGWTHANNGEFRPPTPTSGSPIGSSSKESGALPPSPTATSTPSTRKFRSLSQVDLPIRKSTLKMVETSFGGSIPRTFVRRDAVPLSAPVRAVDAIPAPQHATARNRTTDDDARPGGADVELPGGPTRQSSSAGDSAAAFPGSSKMHWKTQFLYGAGTVEEAGTPV